MMRMSAGIREAVPGPQSLQHSNPGSSPVRHFGPIDTLSNGEKTVSLVCALECDAFFLKRILSDLGFVSLRKVLSVSGKQCDNPTNYAAIICHRSMHTYPDSSLALGGLADRVIVFSDCQKEQTAIDFLTNGARQFFDIRESRSLIQARLYAALRHHYSSLKSSLVFGDIELDRQRSIASRGGQTVKLTPKEFAFACQLFSKVGQVVCNEELMTSIWSLPANMDTRRIDSAASLVRKKLRLVSSEGWELKRIRCVGYQLNRMSDNLL